MTTTEITKNGLTLKVDDGDFTLLSVLSDVGLRAGTPIDSVEWLDGNAGGDYPGTLAGFNAANTDGNAEGSLRMVTLSFNIVATGVEPMVITAGASKIVGIMGLVGANLDEVVSASFTHTGIKNAVNTSPAATGGLLPAFILDSEGANNVCNLTFLMLN